MHFPSTHWSLLAQATLSGEPAGRSALNDLCQRYWQPLNGYIRRRGYDEAEAADLTQQFLLHLLEHRTLDKADPARGKFRSFLLGSLQRFLGDERDRRLAHKRGSGAVHLSIDDVSGPVPAVEPETLRSFDRDWAIAIVEHALAELETDSKATGSERLAVLRRFLPGSVEPLSYEAAAAELQLSLPALKSEVHRLRQRFRALVRQQIAETVGTPHEIEEEMHYLQEVLMDPGHDFPHRQKPLPPRS
jgi:RNA polymerase sigma-70 factor (ECF subfamily)